MESFKIWNYLLLISFMLPLLHMEGASGDELCYNIVEQEWHSCAAGCCGTGGNVQCCLSNFVVCLIILGVLLCLVVAIITACWIYKKKTSFRREIDPRCTPQDRPNCNVSVVHNSNLRWPFITQPLQPPPYTVSPPPYSTSTPENIGHSPASNQQHTLLSNNTENQPASPQSSLLYQETQSTQQQTGTRQHNPHTMTDQSSTEHSNVSTSQAPPLYSFRDRHNSNIQNLSLEPPPQYGVYAELVNTRRR